MMVLQNKDGQILRPSGYMIFELWMHWKLTITTTRISYVDGKEVDRSVSKESTSWNELQGRYKKLIEAPGIWEQFGLPPFGKLKGIVALFPLPDHFNPAEWSLVKHETAKSTMFGTEVIKTVSFAFDLGQGKKNNLTFERPTDGKTAYQRAHACQPYEGIMNAAMRMFVPGELVAGKQKKPSQYTLNKTKVDATHWAKILILQPGPTSQWLKDYHSLSQNMQVDAAVAMADIMLRIVTGSGLGSWDSGQWERDFSRLGKHVRNLAIAAATRWKHGMSTRQTDELLRSYSKLSPGLKQVFEREFAYTLAMNLFLDLRQPEPVVLKPARRTTGGASIR